MVRALGFKFVVRGSIPGSGTDIISVVRLETGETIHLQMSGWPGVGYSTL